MVATKLLHSIFDLNVLFTVLRWAGGNLVTPRHAQWLIGLQWVGEAKSGRGENNALKITSALLNLLIQGFKGDLVEAALRLLRSGFASNQILREYQRLHHQQGDLVAYGYSRP